MTIMPQSLHNRVVDLMSEELIKDDMFDKTLNSGYNIMTNWHDLNDDVAYQWEFKSDSCELQATIKCNVDGNMTNHLYIDDAGWKHIVSFM